MRLGRYWRSSPLVFLLLPQGVVGWLAPATLASLGLARAQRLLRTEWGAALIGRVVDRFGAAVSPSSPWPVTVQPAADLSW
ncbi:MAG: hypothetical protein GX875_02805 [Propionibacterium sp.]|nr:hypothetical protein [Propionibacterium sp.]